MAFFRTRRVVIALLVCAGVAGYFWIGALLDEIPIGLDPSAFPAGGAIQTAAQWIWPDLLHTFAGVFWLAISLLCIALAVFFVVRASVRHGLDPARRRFLTGVATGVAASAASLVVALGAGAARAFLGLGRGGRGWQRVADDIFMAPVAGTHSEWPDTWKGSWVRAHRRLAGC